MLWYDVTLCIHHPTYIPIYQRFSNDFPTYVFSLGINLTEHAGADSSSEALLKTILQDITVTAALMKVWLSQKWIKTAVLMSF